MLLTTEPSLQPPEVLVFVFYFNSWLNTILAKMCSVWTDGKTFNQHSWAGFKVNRILLGLKICAVDLSESWESPTITTISLFSQTVAWCHQRVRKTGSQFLWEGFIQQLLCHQGWQSSASHTRPDVQKITEPHSHPLIKHEHALDLILKWAWVLSLIQCKSLSILL